MAQVLFHMGEIHKANLILIRKALWLRTSGSIGSPTLRDTAHFPSEAEDRAGRIADNSVRVGTQPAERPVQLAAADNDQVGLAVQGHCAHQLRDRAAFDAGFEAGS